MNTDQAIAKLDKKVIPVAALDSIETTKKVCDYLIQQGCDVIEVTYRTDIAGKAIEFIKANYDLTVGAGTVLNRRTAADALARGADFIVSPGLDDETVRYCRDKGWAMIPGVETASDILRALSLGVKFVKFFPAEAIGGIEKLKALHAPFPDMKFMPTGGITKEIARAYLALDCVVCCGGSYLIPKGL